MNDEEKAAWKKRWIETFANQPYQPSNGTEGMGFIENWCSNCIHEKWMHTQDDDDAKCEVLTATFVDDDFSKWFYDDKGSPYCTCFKKWDWGFDDDNDGGFNEPPEIIPDDPNQLVLPFIIEGCLKQEIA